MRYLLSSLSSTGKVFFGLLCAGTLLASCEKSPDDFGNNPVSSTLPLKKVALDSLKQFVLILPPQQGSQGVGITIPPPIENMVEIILNTGEGTLTDGERGPRITLHFASPVPMKEGFEIEQATGYSLKNFSMDLEITPLPADSTIQLAQNHCATNNAVLTITRKEHYWDPPQQLTIPIEATIDGLKETTNDEGETVYAGKLHLYSFYWPDNRQDLFVYNLEANIRIE